MQKFIDIEGQYFPGSHPGYSEHAQELFFYTSRYYGYAEQFLRGLSGQRRFSLRGYQANKLSDIQRRVMAGYLSRPPTIRTAKGIIAVVNCVIHKDSGVPLRLRTRTRNGNPHPSVCHYLPNRNHQSKISGVPSIDPLLNLARRHGIPVKTRGRHINLSFTALARALDSPSPAVRESFHDAITLLHEAGYHIHRL